MSPKKSVKSSKKFLADHQVSSAILSKIPKINTSKNYGISVLTLKLTFY